MSEVQSYPHGTFSWVELVTTDREGAKAFYTELFGWSFNDMPVSENMVYTMLQHDEREVAALFQMGQEMKQQGIPPHWGSYVTVTNVEEAAEKAKSLGGTIMQEPFDVFDAGRMAVLQDPTGAVFMLWQAGNHIGAKLVNEPGSFCWNELATRDTEVAKQFYSGLFDWSHQTQNMGDVVYTSFMNGDRPAGGMMAITEEWGDVPPHWAVYFAVSDCEQAVEKAQSLGGKLLVEPTDIPEVGRFAIIQDPQGASFYAIKLLNPE